LLQLDGSGERFGRWRRLRCGALDLGESSIELGAVGCALHLVPFEPGHEAGNTSSRRVAGLGADAVSQRRLTEGRLDEHGVLAPTLEGSIAVEGEEVGGAQLALGLRLGAGLDARARPLRCVPVLHAVSHGAPVILGRTAGAHLRGVVGIRGLAA
jgi:hypothetical protein